ncbi:MAG: aminopeptidase N [Pseudomonadota bacterium]
MPDTAPPPAPTRLADYLHPAWLVEEVALTFRLDPKATRVTARIAFAANPARASDGPHDLRLDGEALRLLSASVDDRSVMEGVQIDPQGLTLPAAHLPADRFVWTAETEIDPGGNTALEGLYMSNGMYCTQCEAEGFRKITYYPDRPDVMARFRVRIEGDLPVMLSNGNPVGSGPGWAEWEDPWPKPAYLFALVAGDLVSFDDSFRTASGRQVALRIFVRPGDEGRCAYAMDALKRSMRWDEEAYGREYDLDLFMIVAVDDFNMGAMENKGLNIFNAKYVLASPETATDRDYALIEGIVAHEYFHNWTGNRITCRDWFQLCLKEGLTVYRDQQFSGDERSHAVQRIEDVRALRARQFREDAGPLAHPVRPEEYIEINNFYTATVYEKGAEVIGMLRTLVGAEAYDRALKLYFERHDGEACTIEDWLKVFEDATGRDFGQFALWYRQAGTPRVHVKEEWADGTARLTFRQEVPPTPGQAEKAPMVIPVRWGLIGANGDEIAEGLFELTEEKAVLEVPAPSRPVASLLRGFSAPVILERAVTNEDRAFLLRHDTDPFNKWEAGAAFARDLLTRMTLADAAVEPAFLDAMQAVAEDDGLDPAFRALALTLPTEEEIAAEVHANGGPVDPGKIHAARMTLERHLADHLSGILTTFYDDMAVPGPYAPDAEAAGRRALRLRALALLTRADPEARAAQTLFQGADNMTEQMAALTALVVAGKGEEPLAAFYEQWRGDRLVMDKWFGVQAMATPPDAALDAVKTLAKHPDFDWKNPNRFRSLIGAFTAGNPAGFHRADGAGYTLLTDWLIRLDPLNPQTTARLAGTFETWRRLDDGRQEKIATCLDRILATQGLSRDTSEIVSRIRAA